MRAISILLKSLLLVAFFYSAQASAKFYVDDTRDGPTFSRPLPDFSQFADIGPVSYDTFAFSVDADGTYKFRSLALPIAQPWDNMLFLYQLPFDPNNALGNGLIGNDDFKGMTGRSGFDFTLSTGVAYVLVTTGVNSDNAGKHLNLIRGPGNVIDPVPEPETYAMLLAGLAVLGFIARRRRSR
jgi:hypothetical protein